MDRDAFYMRRACRLAERALGNTTPNPIVGAVIVKDGEIPGKAFIQRQGILMRKSKRSLPRTDAG